MPERKLRPLLALTGIVLLTLAFLPATNWLLRLQVGALVLPSSLTGSRETRERRVAENHPDDYQLQVAHALAGPIQADTPSTVKIARLTALAQSFPNEPSLYAHLLRYYAQGTVGIHRVDEDELSATPPVRTGKMQRSLPADLNAYDAACAQGERLDPNNAYFPFMRTAGLYAMGRDVEAVAALHRAAQKTRYEDYASDEFRATDRLYAEAYGRQSSLSRTTVAAALLFPHYALMRGTARISTVSAIRAEQTGNAALGVQIRHDTMRVGDLLRVQGRPLIANLVGIAISAIPVSRPGGSPAIKNDNYQTDAERTRAQEQKRAKYYAYLRSIGRDDEARWAQAELEAGQQTRDISAKIMAATAEHGPYGVQSLRKSGVWWVSDLIVLSNALGLLILGGLALLAHKVRPEMQLSHWRGVLCAAAVVLLGTLAIHFARMATDLTMGQTILLNLQETDRDNAAQALTGIARLVGIALSLALPLLLVAAIGLGSWKARESFSDSLGRWLRAIAIPTACGLLVIYGGLLMGTARQENLMSANLEQMVTHEAAHLAELSGLKLPGTVR